MLTRIAATLLLALAPLTARAAPACEDVNPRTASWATVDACTPQARDDSLPRDTRARAWLQIGRAHTALGLTTQAGEDLTRAARLFTTPRDKTSAAWALFQAGQSQQALALYDATLGRDPSMRHAWLARCVVQQDLEDWRGSRRSCRRAWDMDHGGEDVLYFLSRAFIMTDSPVNAVNFTRYGTQQFPDSGRLWVTRVWAEEIAGNRTEARRIATEQIRTDPDNIGLQNYLRETAP